MISEITQQLDTWLQKVPEGKQNNLRDRVTSLSERLSESPWSRGKPLSYTITLLDLRTAMEVDREIATKMKQHLKLEKGVEDLEEEIAFEKSLFERQQLLLSKVSLRQIELIGDYVELKDSPIWYALASNEEVASRTISDLENYGADIGVICCRLPDIKTEEHGFTLKMLGVLMTTHTIAEIAGCTGKQLNEFGTSLPLNTCRILSDTQLKGLDFHEFTPEQLDAIIKGNGDKGTGWRRFNALDEKQKAIFIDKANHRYSSEYIDAFLSSLEGMTYDFRKWSPEQIEHVFRLLHCDSLKHCKKRVSLIECTILNGVVEKFPPISKYLTPRQYEFLDVELLGREEVQNLFPGFSKETLHPGYKYGMGDGRHKFTSQDGSCMTSYSLEEYGRQTGYNQGRCEALLRIFSEEQIRLMMPKMFPEVQKLAEKELNK